MRESTPSVFLSSAVLDLADLGSAIKFWLADFGYLSSFRPPRLQVEGLFDLRPEN
jgi:hypothetical protein